MLKLPEWVVGVDDDDEARGKRRMVGKDSDGECSTKTFPDLPKLLFRQGWMVATILVATMLGIIAVPASRRRL